MHDSSNSNKYRVYQDIPGSDLDNLIDNVNPEIPNLVTILVYLKKS
jgi:hypothetical protein